MRAVIPFDSIRSFSSLRGRTVRAHTLCRAAKRAVRQPSFCSPSLSLEDCPKVEVESSRLRFSTLSQCPTPTSGTTSLAQSNLSNLFVAPRFPRVVLGMSGGVDSSVSALLLKEQGYDVRGVYMKNWEELEETGECTGEHDMRDAARVCQQLNIPFSSVDFVKEYWTLVFDTVLRDYEAGITPNPDVLCNREIKFRHFLDYAVTSLGAEFVATGHYARLQRWTDAQGGEYTRLLQGVDAFKDQSYFLALVEGKAFHRVLFPVGNLTKSQVRERAREAMLHVSEKRGSAGICFVGRRDFPRFISEYLRNRPGDIVSLEDGSKLGVHNGLFSRTIGQAVRLSGMPSRYFVADKDVRGNRMLVVQGQDHPALFAVRWTIHHLSWIGPTFPYAAALLASGGQPVLCHFRIRHQGVIHQGTLRAVPDSTARARSRRLQPVSQEQAIQSEAEQQLVMIMEVVTADAVRGVAPGQTVVFYNGEECYGGATVGSVLATLYVQPLK